ncbi:hypothetical protein HYU96_00850 [Candidatus Daviesbacteria bacterium]|nr:hypothetical protein [Candidatus Daviesbacteria bacterium]
MIKVKQAGKFTKLLDELYVENPELEIEVSKRIRWFQDNPEDSRLDNHVLTKRMKSKWAFSITDDIRIVYEWLGKTTVRLLAIGGHKKAYKRKFE